MISISGEKCPSCGKETILYSAKMAHKARCLSCQRKWHPPWMTLVKFSQGSVKQLWNLEIGQYETFDRVEDLSLCDWSVKCRQDTLYSRVPKIRATVYHLNYYGDIPCGRCYKYPYFEPGQECLSQACQPFAKARRHECEIQYPPERSKYIQWTTNLY